MYVTLMWSLFLIGAPILEWYMARLVVKSEHQKDVSYCAHKILTVLGFGSCEHNLCDASKIERIFTLFSHDFCISGPVYMGFQVLSLKSLDVNLCNLSF